MKINIEIDASPQEVRSMLGLPEVEELQRELVDKLRERMMAAIDEQNPAELMKQFMPGADQLKSLEALQQSFWKAFAQGGKAGGSDRD